MTMNADSEIRTKASLCTGTGSLDLATPGELSWYSEIAPGPAGLLGQEYPGVVNHGDFTRNFNLTEVQRPDLLTSGDPCQSMSAAGRQLASDDSRFLWPYVMRVIRDLQPHHVFLENVQNLRSVALVKGGERGGVLKFRLDNLREAGYAVKWTVLGACAVGAPHHRHRWFLRALYVGANAPEAIEIKNKCGAPRNGGRILLPTPTTRDGMGGPGRSDKRTGGDNLRTAVQFLLPTPRATDIGTEGRRSSDGWRPQLGQAVNALLPTPRATDGVNGGPNQRGSKGDLAMGTACQEQHWGKFAKAVALWESIIGRPAPDPTVPAPRGGRRLNPELSEWMMGYPKGFLTSRLERNEALKAAGNGVVTLQARAAWEMLEIKP